jgi:molybdenum cofactor biosynthesis enzyme MoaA
MLSPAKSPPPLAATPLRGWIQPHALDELWFHTGTACNLACPFCLEGSRPGDNRLQRITRADARPFIEEAVQLGVRQFSFTGGEPFIVKDFVKILGDAAAHRPCLVLTNGTAVVQKRLRQIAPLAAAPNPVSFRISIDYADEARHDAGRGPGSFRGALAGMRALHALGFSVSLARQMSAGEDQAAVDGAFRALLEDHGLPGTTRIVAFPDFGLPGDVRSVPTITEDCMTRYHTEATRRAFMCAFSKMVIKRDGQMRVYACTLVDDDPGYDLGGTLAAALSQRITLAHHRCYACFRYGSSCSEMPAAGTSVPEETS